ncbi:unnamed protein product [Ceratitis capitata]|uniref:(Mediterranean fruit fly) hypothetical protein n=1 Tax=Ceratitis capitata TaxID=7213 RepID=A0A811TZP2_CERCA|nr:unnamed protein product [Ceratitis capitata]
MHIKCRESESLCRRDHSKIPKAKHNETTKRWFTKKGSSTAVLKSRTCISCGVVPQFLRFFFKPFCFSCCSLPHACDISLSSLVVVVVVVAMLMPLSVIEMRNFYTLLNPFNAICGVIRTVDVSSMYRHLDSLALQIVKFLHLPSCGHRALVSSSSSSSLATLSPFCLACNAQHKRACTKITKKAPQQQQQTQQSVRKAVIHLQCLIHWIL